MREKNVTIRDLAEAAGVSIGTVSRALKNQAGLSEQTRAKVLQMAQDIGYDASRLRNARPRRVLFLFNRTVASLSGNPFYSVVLQGVEQFVLYTGVRPDAAEVRRAAAVALGADKLVLLTDVEGVLGADGVLIPSLTAVDARNQLDGLVYQTEKTLAEHGGSLDATRISPSLKRWPCGICPTTPARSSVRSTTSPLKARTTCGTPMPLANATCSVR